MMSIASFGSLFREEKENGPQPPEADAQVRVAVSSLFSSVWPVEVVGLWLLHTQYPGSLLPPFGSNQTQNKRQGRGI